MLTSDRAASPVQGVLLILDPQAFPAQTVAGEATVPTLPLPIQYAPLPRMSFALVNDTRSMSKIREQTPTPLSLVPTF